jgi:hypothetical protein
MKKIAVIGAGVFGCSVAIELDKQGFEVTLFEKTGDILTGASTNNHLRHHHGYHYPRSKETARESIEGRSSFEKEYGRCVFGGFPAYYAVKKEGSKTTSGEFKKFCDDLGLGYEIVEPDPTLFNLSKIDTFFKIPEPAYNPETLKKIIKEKLKKTRVNLRLNSEIIKGEILNNTKKKLKIITNNKEFEEEFDYIVSAIYSNFNKINEWFGFPKQKFRYDLMELIDVQLPIKERVAAMVIDGDFSTFVPLETPGIVRLGHVKKSILKGIIADSLDTDSLIKENLNSNKDEIMKESIQYYPILKKAKFLKSTFIVRIVKAGVEATDERPSEITDHGRGIYSIFGGKVITAVSAAKKVTEKIMMKESLNSYYDQ